jgi:hypothetical protein
MDYPDPRATTLSPWCCLIRGATLVNPDSILMREFLDSSFLKAPQC